MTEAEKRAFQEKVMSDLRQEMSERRRVLKQGKQEPFEVKLAREIDEKSDLRSLAQSVAQEAGIDPRELYFSLLEDKAERDRIVGTRKRAAQGRSWARTADERAAVHVVQEQARRKTEEEREYLHKCKALALANPVQKIPDEIKLDLKRLETYANLLKPNETVALYYRMLAEAPENHEVVYETEPGSENIWKEVPSLRLRKKAYSISHCANVWDFELHEGVAGADIYDLKSIPYCKDRFCALCQKKMADARYNKYRPECDKLFEEYDLYHLTLTQPNIFGWDLVKEVDRMFQGFRVLSRYLSCRAKIRGSLFSTLGYYGMLRSFELTIPRPGEFHPHFHVVLILKKGLNFSAKHFNTYSYDNKGGDPKPFSDLELLIQKVWYLILNGEKVTQPAIDALELGYSCRCTKFEEKDYKEVFKYAIKPMQKDERFSSADFKIMQRALEHRKMFQGYGAFYGVTDVDLNSDELTEYDRIKGWLSTQGEPVREMRKFSELRGMLESGDVIISRKCCDVELDEETGMLKRKEKEQNDKV